MLLACASLAAPGRTLASPPAACAPGVRQLDDTEDLLGYRLRGSRCEGRYGFEPFSGPAPIRLTGFTESFADYPLDGRRSLQVEWPLPANSPIALEAVALAPRVYYRMDASPPPAERAFHWPLDVLAGLGLRHAEIGVLAHTRLPVGNTVRDVLLPLRLGLDRPAPRGRTYRLILQSEVEPQNVYVSVSSVQPDGSPGVILLNGMPQSPVVGEHGFEVSLDRPTKSGLYKVEVGVRAEGEVDPSGLVAWFYSD